MNYDTCKEFIMNVSAQTFLEAQRIQNLAAEICKKNCNNKTWETANPTEQLAFRALAADQLGFREVARDLASQMAIACG
ncbi:MAG: hypothetical protein ABL903_04210 [Methylococcales bacterium]